MKTMVLHRLAQVSLMSLVIIQSVLGVAQGVSDNLADEWPDDWSNDEWADMDDAEDESSSLSAWTVNGFTELAGGQFIRTNLNDEHASLLENRWQLSASTYFDELYVSSKVELLADGVSEPSDRTGHISVLIRELYADYNLMDSLSLRAGQQVLTWGTGDFVFLNDFFPKDWQSMFSGRDDSYLKAPSTSFKLTGYSELLNLDVVWTPNMTPDTFISGERFAYFNPSIGQLTNQRLYAEEPANQIENSELGLRANKTQDGIEYAIYGYRGFYKQPLGFDAVSGSNVFPRLNSLGASVRGPLISGIANLEIAYWDSVNDRTGGNPFIPNSEWRGLIGFEREAMTNLTFGVQWFVQKTEDYRAFRLNSLQPAYLIDEWHHTLTTRLTYLAWQQKLTLSVFGFYSPDSQDYYLKPKISYRMDDHWFYELGANEFGGADNFTQWGQFQDSSNVYGRVKYTF